MNLVLIGYRGSGKTTVGRILAERRDLGFIDTDELITHLAGQDIAAVFAAEGEAGFRRREADAIKAATSKGNRVVSVGGGAVESDANCKRLRRWGTVVWLEAPPETLWKRIAEDPASSANRPDLAGGGQDEVREILERRAPLYASTAHFVVRTEGRSSQQVADDVESWLSTV